MAETKIVWAFLNWIGIPSYMLSVILLINIDAFKSIILLVMGSIVVIVRLYYEIRKGNQNIRLRELEIKEKEIELEEKEIDFKESKISNQNESNKSD